MYQIFSPASDISSVAAVNSPRPPSICLAKDKNKEYVARVRSTGNSRARSYCR